MMPHHASQDDGPRLDVSNRLKTLLHYRKFAAPVPRLLILESRYWLDGACMNAARRLGWEFETVPVVTEGVLPKDSVARLLEALTTFKPDFIFTVNLSGMDVDGMFARLFEDLRIPYVTWFVDDPRTIIMGRTAYASPYAVALTWDAAYVDYLKHCGFPVVHHMPLAADTVIFDAEPNDVHGLPPTFVGSSMTGYAEQEWTWFDDRPDLRTAMLEAFDLGRVTRQNFGEGIAAILGEGRASRLDAEARRHVELVLFIEGTRRLRHEWISSLAPEGIHVRGDPGWLQVLPSAGGPVDYARDLPDFYRRCQVNLNITSIQMPTTVNQRVFDCPAAGGFLLTDRQASLGNLFDLDSEVVSYDSFDECRDLLRFYRTRPEFRKAVAAHARRRILAEHTYVHRLEQMVRIMKNSFAA